MELNFARLRFVLFLILPLIAALLAFTLPSTVTRLAARELAGDGDFSPSYVTAPSAVANCRYGTSADRSERHILPQLGAGVFYDWRHLPPEPLPVNDAQYLHMIRTRQKKTSTGEYLSGWYPHTPFNDELKDLILNNLGAVWLIGNEPERGPNPGEIWSANTGDMYPAVYAEAYHDAYHFIKGIDPTARIANAGLIQITPMRLQYLDKVWQAYREKYGAPMPVDIWTMHAYVLPELTPDGQPNSIASAALGTDLELGKRGSGGFSSECFLDDVYCQAEHDSLPLLEQQVVAMRQWMKAHDQRSKPLVITEYGTLYPYFIMADGICRIRDEYGACFTPQRVSDFMQNTFAYFETAVDPALGMPTDGNRLVQQWIWYDAFAWDVGSSNLLKDDLATLTLQGKTFRDHVQAQPLTNNLVVDRVGARVTSNNEAEIATAELSAVIRNSGSTSIDQPFTVAFYEDAALTQLIATAAVEPPLGGCATAVAKAHVEWTDLAKGNHRFWVKLDDQGMIEEESEADNVANGQVEVAGPVYNLHLSILSEGDATGGSVTVEPEGLVYPQGTEVKLTAVPASGWHLARWSGSVIGTVPQITVTVDQDIFLEATFERDHYQLYTQVNGQGSIRVTPEAPYYLYGEKVKLEARPSDGWRFVQWQGDRNGSDPQIEHTFDGDLNLIAVFAEAEPPHTPPAQQSHRAFQPAVFAAP